MEFHQTRERLLNSRPRAPRRPRFLCRRGELLAAAPRSLPCCCRAAAPFLRCVAAPPVVRGARPLRHPTPLRHRVAAMPPTLRKRKAPPSEPRRRPPFRLEFRAPVDGAWYDARVTVQCGALRVMYEGFPEELDEWYDPAALAAAAAAAYVATLRARFRVRSTPLEDTQCRDLRAGALLCVSCALDGGELKFYDAVLESALPAAHEIVDGKERCACRFTVRWSEGPRAGSREEVGVEQVCCVQSSPVLDPVLIEFLDSVTKLLGDVNGEMVSQEIRAVPAAEGGVPADAPPGFHRKFGFRK